MRAAGDFVVLTTNAGINLYLSHNPESTGVSSVIPELRQLSGLSGWTCFEYPALVRGVERRLGRAHGTLRHSEASAYGDAARAAQAGALAAREAGAEPEARQLEDLRDGYLSRGPPAPAGGR